MQRCKGRSKVDETYFDELNGRYIAYQKIFREWDVSVYNGSEQLSMIIYLENRLNGFGGRNDELLRADASGKLFQEATRGFEFSQN